MVMEEKVNYNDIPVYYCKHCLSLLVKCDAPIDYCDNCSSTDIGCCSLEEYDAMHLKRFGRKVFYKDK
jgi:hypothetical protein